MGALATALRPRPSDRPPAGGADRGGVTLEERLDHAWRAAVEATAECPLCHGTMAREGGSVVCHECGSSVY
jgi:hypothetical protein